MYNTNYYKDEKMLQLKPYAEAIHTFKTGDGTIIAIFQGNRGDNPELDFRVKYLNDDPNARPVQLPHVDWVVDLLIKAQKYPNEVKELLDYFDNSTLNVPSRAFSNVPFVADSNVPHQKWLL